MARGERRRALRQAAKEEAGEFVLLSVARRVGEGLWYVATLPVRLLLRAADSVGLFP